MWLKHTNKQIFALTMSQLFWDIVSITFSIIMILLLIYGIIWLFTKGPLGGIVSSITGAFSGISGIFGGGSGSSSGGSGGLSGILHDIPGLNLIPGI